MTKYQDNLNTVDDNVIIGKRTVKGSRNTIIEQTDSNGNVFLNNAPVSIGYNAKSCHNGIAIGSGACAGIEKQNIGNYEKRFISALENIPEELSKNKRGDPQIVSLKTVLAGILSETNYPKIMDFGCGKGTLIHTLHEISNFTNKKWVYIGINKEIGKDLIDTFSQLCKMNHESQLLKYSDFLEIDKIDCNIIVLKNVIHEIQSIKELGEIIYRLLKTLNKEGRIIIIDMELSLDPELGNCHYPEIELKKLLEENGLNCYVVKFKSHNGVDLHTIVGRKIEEHKSAKAISDRLLSIRESQLESIQEEVYAQIKNQKADNGQQCALQAISIVAIQKQINDYKNAISQNCVIDEDNMTIGINKVGDRYKCQILLNIGNDYDKCGDMRNAIIAYEKVLEINAKCHKAWYDKGYIFDKLGKYDEAIYCYDKSLEIDPKYIHALTNKAIILSRYELNKEAIKYYDKVLEIDPKNIRALNNKGTILNDKCKRHKYAIECFDKILRIDPKNLLASSNKVVSLFNWGLALSESSNMKIGKEKEEKLMQAIEKYESALKIKPDKYDIINNLGVVFSEISKMKIGKDKEEFLLQAIEKYEYALKINSDRIEALENLTIDLLELSKMKEGKEKEEIFEKYNAIKRKLDLIK